MMERELLITMADSPMPTGCRPLHGGQGSFRRVRPAYLVIWKGVMVEAGGVELKRGIENRQLIDSTGLLWQSIATVPIRAGSIWINFQPSCASAPGYDAFLYRCTSISSCRT